MCIYYTLYDIVFLRITIWRTCCCYSLSFRIASSHPSLTTAVAVTVAFIFHFFSSLSSFNSINKCSGFFVALCVCVCVFSLLFNIDQLLKRIYYANLYGNRKWAMRNNSTVSQFIYIWEATRRATQTECTNHTHTWIFCHANAYEPIADEIIRNKYVSLNL